MQNLKKILKNKKGFTLVELMVVVAILGILVAVAVPVYSNVTANAEAKTCAANVRTIKSAISAYNASTGEWPDETGDWADVLVQGGYLESEPKCPISGENSYDYQEPAAASTDTNGSPIPAEPFQVSCDHQ